MRATHPKVRMVAHTQVDWSAITDYLKSVGGMAWLDRVLTTTEPEGHGSWEYQDGDLLVEFGGRVCYRSWAPGLNANVTKVREDSASYLENVLASGHGSVLEHFNITFMLQDISRVLTHELVRHRAGVAISQESLRYVRLTDLPFELPQHVMDSPELLAEALDLLSRMESFQLKQAEVAGIDEPSVPFHTKKAVTSAMRRFAPIGLATSMLWTCNARTLRHTLEARTSEGAEEEIRRVFDQIGLLAREVAPLLLQDFERIPDEDGEHFTWKPKYSKV